MSTTALVRAVVFDISADRLAAPSALSMLLLHRLPVDADHAIGVVDLDTGLVAEWVIPGPDPLDRWVCERPQIHPDDASLIATARAHLRAGDDRHDQHFRLRFPSTAWIHVDAQWTVLTRLPTPQAMLDLRLTALPDPVPAEEETT